MASELRIPPNFIEGERAILGGLLIDNTALPKVAMALEKDDFYRENHRIVYGAILELFRAGEPADWLTLTKQLNRFGHLENIGGPAFLTDLANAVPSTANIMKYVSDVREASRRRQLILACNEAQNRCFNEDEQFPEIVASLGQMSFKLATDSDDRKAKSLVSVQEINANAYKNLMRRIDTGIVPGILTGFTDLDRKTGGFQNGDLNLLAGRPSTGKTSFAMNAIRHVARTYGRVDIFSLEMQRDAIWARLIAQEAHVPVKTIIAGIPTPTQISKLTTAAGIIEDLNMQVSDGAGMTPFDTYAQLLARSTELREEPALIVVDFLQQMRSTEKIASRDERVGQIASDLKDIAKQMNRPVLAVSVLNRECEKRPLKDKRPILSDLGESGKLEYVSDQIWGLFRLPIFLTNDEEKEKHKHEAEIIVMKHRNGATGAVPLYWDPPMSMFHDHSKREEREYPPNWQDREAM